MTTVIKVTVGLLSVWMLVAPAWAVQSIEVTGEAVVEVVPDMIWIEGELTASGEMQEADKIVLGLKQDITRALSSGDFAQIKPTFDRKSISTAGGTPQDEMQLQMMQMMGGELPAATREGDFRIQERFRLTLSGLTESNFPEAVQQMAKLATALTDVQIKLSRGGSSAFNPFAEISGEDSFLRVGLADPDPAWREASQQAFADAKAKAAALAEIAGGQLGPAESIELVAGPMEADETSNLQELFIARFSGAGSITRRGLSQKYLDKLPLRVVLRVRFAYQAQ